MARILLVEDDDMIREVVLTTLELYDHTIITAESGVAAIERARADRPELILMDVGLPLLDGYEATRRLKADEQTRGIPVIILTAAAGQEEVGLVRARGGRTSRRAGRRSARCARRRGRPRWAG